MPDFLRRYQGNLKKLAAAGIDSALRPWLPADEPHGVEEHADGGSVVEQGAGHHRQQTETGKGDAGEVDEAGKYDDVFQNDGARLAGDGERVGQAGAAAFICENDVRIR